MLKFLGYLAEFLNLIFSHHTQLKCHNIYFRFVSQIVDANDKAKI